MSENKKFHGIVRLDPGTGEIICFCSYDDYLRKRCECRERFNCPEAMIEITVIPGTRPSDQTLAPLKEAKRNIQKVSKSMNSIKKGVSRLEREMKRFPRT